MKRIFDEVSNKCSRITTLSYSTSFSLGIYFLDKNFHEPIYSIYGFVRFADEVVDSFHQYDKKGLLKDFKNQAYNAYKQGISLNPILNSFQYTLKQYNIDFALVETFLNSMEQDLSLSSHKEKTYKEYIAGSAEAVGLMCLKVFVEGDDKKYEELKEGAIKLGAAFQKINFLRDLKMDFEELGRSYFPGVNLYHFTQSHKDVIEGEILEDLRTALIFIKKLPKSSRLGVYLAFVYFKSLFYQLRNVSSKEIMEKRIRVSNGKKLFLLADSYLRYNLNLLQ